MLWLILDLLQVKLWFDIWLAAGHVMVDTWFVTGHLMIWYLISYRPCYGLIFDLLQAMLWFDIWFLSHWSKMRFNFIGHVLVQVILFYFIEVCDVIWHVWQVIIIWPEINVTSFDVKFGITRKFLCFNSWLDFVLYTTWCEMRVGQHSRYRDCPRLGDQGIEVRLPAGERDFSALQST